MKKVRDRANDSDEKTEESKDQAQFVSHLGYIDSCLEFIQLFRNRIKQTVLIVPAKHQESDMKYMCRTCKKKCDDIPKHMMTVHKFSKKIVEDQLKANPNCYKNSFTEL